MSDIDSQIRSAITQFADSLVRLAKQAAIASVVRALGGAAPAAATATAQKAAPPAKKSRRSKKKSAAKPKAVVAAKVVAPSKSAPAKVVAPSKSAPAKVAALPKAAPAKKAKNAGRVRRDEAQIAATKKLVLDYIAKNPGKRSEQLRPGLKLDRAVFTDAITRLKADKKIKSKGQKRATTYWV